MELPPDDALRFMLLYELLLMFADMKSRQPKRSVVFPKERSFLEGEQASEFRQKLVKNRGLIEEFVRERPVDLDDADIETVRGWTHFVFGKFFILKEQKQHTLFLSSSEPAVAYGVLGLLRPIEDMIGGRYPSMVTTMLLPLDGKIVYDGYLESPGISLSFGGGVKRMFNDSYRNAKARFGIVKSLPMTANAT